MCHTKMVIFTVMSVDVIMINTFKVFEKVYWDYSRFYHYLFSQAIPKIQLISHRGLTLFCRGGRVWHGPLSMSVIKTQLKLAKAKRKITSSGSTEMSWALFAFAWLQAALSMGLGHATSWSLLCDYRVLNSCEFQTDFMPASISNSKTELDCPALLNGSICGLTTRVKVKKAIWLVRLNHIISSVRGGGEVESLDL